MCYGIQQRILCRNCSRQRLKANNGGENFVKRRGGQLEMGSERQSGLDQLGSQWQVRRLWHYVSCLFCRSHFNCYAEISLQQGKDRLKGQVSRLWLLSLNDLVWLGLASSWYPSLKPQWAIPVILLRPLPSHLPSGLVTLLLLRLNTHDNILGEQRLILLTLLWDSICQAGGCGGAEQIIVQKQDARGGREWGPGRIFRGMPPVTYL